METNSNISHETTSIIVFIHNKIFLIFWYFWYFDIIVVSSNTPDTITEQQMYCEGNIEKCLKEDRTYYEENQERLQTKMTCDRYKALCKDKKN